MDLNHSNIPGVFNAMRKLAARFSISLTVLAAMCGCSQLNMAQSGDKTSDDKTSGENGADVKKHEVRKIIGNEQFLKHPYYPAVQRAKESLGKINEIKDYTAILVKRERIKTKLYDYSYMRIKVRHKPFSVYLKFLSPPEGREVIYVEGKNSNQILTSTPPLPKDSKATWVDKTAAFLYREKDLDPNSDMAMIGNRYPITKIGIKNMLEELIKVGEADMNYDSAEIKYYNNATLNGKPVKAFRFIHTRETPLLNNPEGKYKFRFQIAEVFMDKKTELPIRYAAYQWPKEKGKPPVLVEEYTYLKLRTNIGLTDEDFDKYNKKYNYPKKKK